MNNLPLIIIKKIILHLIRYKNKNILKFFFLSKSIQTFIIKQIEILSFKDIKSFKQFKNDSKNEIKNQITEIKIKNELVNHLENLFFDSNNYNNNNKDCFKLLEIIQISCKPENYYLLNSFSKTNDRLLFKIKSKTATPRLFTEEILFSKSIFGRLKKIKFIHCDPLSINNVKYLFKKPYLESIDIPLSTIFYVLSNWLDGDDDDEIEQVESEIKNSIKEFQEWASSNSILKTISLRELYFSHRWFSYKKPNYKIFINQSIPSILSSPFSNISKFCLYGFALPNEYSIFDYLSTEKIKKLKLVHVIGLDSNWPNFIRYCQKNQSLKQLSIRGNSIEDKDNLFSNLILKNHNSLSKLDISHNFFNLQLIIESILQHYYQFSKIIISDSSILPFNTLLSNADRLLSYYDQGGNSHLCLQYRIESKKKKILLNPSFVQDLKESFYSTSDLSDIFNFKE
ncbi:hypothetical protein ACTFIY_004768 [Dictyostelium cf. discoideum]